MWSCFEAEWWTWLSFDIEGVMGQSLSGDAYGSVAWSASNIENVIGPCL